jgi:hypothetical protein
MTSRTPYIFFEQCPHHMACARREFYPERLGEGLSFPS